MNKQIQQIDDKQFFAFLIIENYKSLLSFLFYWLPQKIVPIDAF